MTQSASLHPFDVLLEIDKRNHEAVASTAQSAQSAVGAGRLAVRVGSWNLMLPMEFVAEIVPVPRITRVPGVKSWLLGIANLRGTILSVVDLPQFLGGGISQLTPNSRLVVVRSGEWEYGLLVQDVIGMRHSSRLAAAPPGTSVDPGLNPYVIEGFESDNQFWWVFEVNHLLNEPQFLDAIA
ncbi:MAG: chemotaxis protein CheW [Gammaproteobacteria bacterium]|nr:chemotaxis protein CheW [Gammaproteobacteria bacterium]MCP5458052.1 chemotaxis protein CheW [Gammaproteobacteria bacterium]